jgi:IS5 family transposase
VAPHKIRHGEWRSAELLPDDMPPGLSRKEQMAHRLRTLHGRAEYDKRKITVEPVFGQIKEARGFRRFLLRGLTQVQSEWRLICAAHNLLKLRGRGWKPKSGAEPAPRLSVVAA